MNIIHPIDPEEVMAYVDGELTSDRAAATAAHLGECAECQGLAASLRGVSQDLKTWKVEVAEAAVPASIAAVLAKNRLVSRRVLTVRRSWRFLGRHWPAVASLGAVAAVLLVAFGTVRVPGGNANNAISSHGKQVDFAVVSQGRDKLATGAAPSTPPITVPMNGRNFTQLSKLQAAPPVSSSGPVSPDQSAVGDNLIPNGPMIIRTAELSLVTKEFDKARANLEAILKRHRGYVGELKAGGSTGSGRTLTATLRVPSDQLDATLAEVKALGRVESESQGGQDVTSQYVDLQARLSNSRNTEVRLTDLLRNRTGKLSDVLEVEQELSRVRGEIEQMEAERKNMANQVSFATLNATITEDYKAELQVVPPSTSTRLGNAAIEGYRSMVDGILSLTLFLLSSGPTLLLWGAILFFPARLIWRKARRSLTL